MLVQGKAQQRGWLWELGTPGEARVSSATHSHLTLRTMAGCHGGWSGVCVGVVPWTTVAHIL